MKRSADTHDRDRENRQDRRPKNADANENEIDEALEESFPASDAPPWTLGVTPELPKEREDRQTTTEGPAERGRE
jgi:hypothetical protein